MQSIRKARLIETVAGSSVYRDSIYSKSFRRSYADAMRETSGPALPMYEVRLFSRTRRGRSYHTSIHQTTRRGTRRLTQREFKDAVSELPAANLRVLSFVRSSNRRGHKRSLTMGHALVGSLRTAPNGGRIVAFAEANNDANMYNSRALTSLSAKMSATPVPVSLACNMQAYNAMIPLGNRKPGKCAFYTDAALLASARSGTDAVEEMRASSRRLASRASRRSEALRIAASVAKPLTGFDLRNMPTINESEREIHAALPEYSSRSRSSKSTSRQPRS